MHYFFKLAAVVCLGTSLFAQEDQLPYVTKSFLIVKSTKVYREAVDFAKAFSKRSGIRLNLRGLHEDGRLMLSESKKSCTSQGYEYPCYIPRGRYDDGIYISIESSDGYKGFAPKNYMVVAASTEQIAPGTLRMVKKYVPDAYMKRTSVYMGCMH